MQAVHCDSVNVYIVDDDSAVRAGISMLVRSRGWTPKAYATANEFLDGYEEGELACLVLDMQMPDMNGAELVDAMAGMGIAVPIIILSALREHRWLDRSAASGVHSVLVKPFGQSELVNSIEQALGVVP